MREDVLRMDGYCAVGGCETNEALQHLRSEPLDTIITDLETLIREPRNRIKGR